jgi:hypothetical protein
MYHINQHAKFLLNLPDPLELPLPAGCVEAHQKNEPILRYCWFLRMDGGNKVWRCKLRSKEFTGSNVLVATHFL